MPNGKRGKSKARSFLINDPTGVEWRALSQLDQFHPTWPKL